MENLVAKNIQKFQTHDGYAWSASFYLDGKKIGTASDQGHGGEVEIRSLDSGALKVIEAHAATLPHFGGDMDLAQDAAMVLEAAMWDTLDLRKTKRLLKSHIVARLSGEKDIHQWKIKKGLSVDLAVATFKTRYTGAKILNDMPLPEANRILNPVSL